MPAGGAQGPPQYGYYDDAYITGSGGSRSWDPNKGVVVNAPAGYEWNPVEHKFIRTPQSAGSNVNAFNQAANPALAGLQSNLAGMLSGAGGGGGVPAANGGLPTTNGGFTSSVGTNGAGTSGISGGARLPTLQMPDQTASNNAIYAGAKDQVGKSSRASIDALRGELGATGNLGGGAEVQGVRDAVISGQGQLGQVSRDLAVKNADMGADFAKTNYAGGITQRGQDVSASEAQARLAQEERLANASMAFQQQQAASAQNLQMLQLALSGLKGLGGGAEGSQYSY